MCVLFAQQVALFVLRRNASSQNQADFCDWFMQSCAVMKFVPFNNGFSSLHSFVCFSLCPVFFAYPDVLI